MFSDTETELQPSDVSSMVVAMDVVEETRLRVGEVNYL